MDGLFCGVLIGYLFHFKPQLLARAANWRLLVAAAVLLTPNYFLDVESRYMYTCGLTCTYLAFACILIWAIHVPPKTGHLLAWPVNFLARIGYYSYSIYLWHWIVIGYLRQYLRYKCLTTGSPFAWTSAWETWQWPLSVIFSIIVGIAMAIVIEMPVLKLRDRWFPSRTRSNPVLARGNELNPIPVLDPVVEADSVPTRVR
jgi:peptidoglycan/LPS O-acetylase OafA/YrhL